eukprot:gene8670-8849_t
MELDEDKRRTGFLGAGKTTLLKHLLRNAGGQRIAVVVNDVAALNIDSALIKGGGLVQSREHLVELQDGCICCSLRLDLVQAIAGLAAQGAFDLLLLESTGVSEPLQVAEIFAADVPVDLPGPGANNSTSAEVEATSCSAAASLLRDVAYLDTAVTVVDAHQLMHNLHSIHTFRETDWELLMQQQRRRQQGLQSAEEEPESDDSASDMDGSDDVADDVITNSSKSNEGDHIGEWSQAGSLLSFTTGGPWFCVLPEEAWPEDEEHRDFAPAVGDRRQELVFIGVELKEQLLRAALDECLVTVAEVEALGFSGLHDPFEPWPDIKDMIDTGRSFIIH